MQIQINTDHTIGAHQAFITEIKEKVEQSLRHFSEHITRVEIHLTDENAHKKGQHDKRCVMEVRLEGRKPEAVTKEAATLEQAVDGAIEKLIHRVGSTLERLREQEKNRTDPPLSESIENQQEGSPTIE